MNFCKIVASLLGAGALCLAAGAGAVTVDLYSGIVPDESIEVEILADGKSLCTVRKAAEATMDAKTPVCRFDLPAAAKHLQLRGKVSWVDWDTKKRRSQSGENVLKLIDFADAGRQLNAPGKPYGERMLAFIEATNRFAHEQLPNYYSPTLLARGKPVTQGEIDAAEKRLGYALPADFVSLMRVAGPFEIGDHRVNRIAEIDNAYHQIVHDWGTPEESMAESYSEDMRAMLKTSTLLFTEVGDGIGGLIYRPGKTKTCGDMPTYYWTSQEGGTDRLKKDDGSCADFAAAFRWVLDEFVMSNLDDTIRDESPQPILMLDSSTGTQRVRISMQTGDKFQVDLEYQWHGPYE